MTSGHHQVVIIGGGHNGLTAAAYLAKAGRRVLVLERRPIVGGSVVTEQFGEGFTADSVWTGGSLRPDILKHLALTKSVWRSPAEVPAFISLLPGSEHLVLHADPTRAMQSIKHFSPKDAAKWPDFLAFMNKAVRFLDVTYSTIMPRVPKDLSLKDGYGLAKLGLNLRWMGREHMLKTIRMLPMTAVEFLEEWFESEPLKAALASLAIHGVTLGVMSAGTGTTLLHNWLNRGGLAHFNAGRAGAITQALAEVVRSNGGEIRLEAEVTGIEVDNYVCKGVVLASGEKIMADKVLSAADPKHTLLSLAGPVNLPPEYVWKTQSIKMRGSVAKVHLLTDGRHGIPDGTVVLAPSLMYLEHAYDAAKYGEVSEHPYLEATSYGNVVSIHFQFAPHGLRHGTWHDRRQQLEDLAIGGLADHFPDLPSSIIRRKTLTPVDLEQTYGLTEGDLNHGQLMLDQFLFMRPIPGWSNHRTPIDGLYLCGSGVHGGGGVSGAAGRNAARIVLAIQ